MRQNQKARRKPVRQVGTYTRNGIERVVELHPTKGFRDVNIERKFKTPGAVTARPYRTKMLTREHLNQIFHGDKVDNKAPDNLHKKTGG